MYENDVDAADTVTFQTVKDITKSGKTKTKKVKIALYPQEPQPQSSPTAGPSHNQDGYFPNDVEMPNDVPISQPKLQKVWIWTNIILLNAINNYTKHKRTIYCNLWKGLMIYWKPY